MDFSPIQKFPGYGVSRNGEIKNLTMGNILKPMSNRYGYSYVNLKVEGVYKNVSIHRVVALVFLGESDLDVNHKNGIKSDNRIENLEYCTKSENIQHRFDYLGQEGVKGENHPSSKKVFCIDKNGKRILFNSVGECQREKKLNKGNILSVLSGRRKNAGGFTFTYA